MTNFIWEAEAFEADEFIVSVRPDWEELWRAIPIGPTLGQKDAKVIAEWLRSSCNDLRQLFYNEFKDEQKEE